MSKKKLTALALLGLSAAALLSADCQRSQTIIAQAFQNSAIADEDEDHENEGHEEDERGAYRGGERNFGENRGLNRGNFNRDYQGNEALRQHDFNELNREQQNKNENGNNGTVNQYPTQPQNP